MEISIPNIPAIGITYLEVLTALTTLSNCHKTLESFYVALATLLPGMKSCCISPVYTYFAVLLILILF